jgi:ABC-2 type transport system ATP-binding protein
VLTTKYLEEADQLADRIVLIDKGMVAASGTADSLKAQVGGDRLDLRFEDETGLARAADLFGGVGALSDRDGLVLGLPSNGSAAHLHLVLDDLRAAGIPVDRVSSHRPTLDDVFVTLTQAHRPDGSATTEAQAITPLRAEGTLR